MVGARPTQQGIPSHCSIRERIAQFDNKLYLEFGGKLFDDYHASRVLPGFQPQWDAVKGAEQLYAAYKKSGITVEEFEGTRYNRIAHIKKLLADDLLNNELRPTGEAVAAE